MSPMPLVLFAITLFFVVPSMFHAQSTDAGTRVDYTTLKANGSIRSLEKGSDVASKVRDAKGRLTQMMEPDAKGELRLETDYSYDDAGPMVLLKQMGLPGDTPRIRSFTYDAKLRVATATSPEAGTIIYTHDDDGNIATKTDALGRTVSYTWTKTHKLLSKKFSTGTPSFIYEERSETQDGRSYLLGALGHIAERVYQLDADKKLIGLTVSIPHPTATATYVVKLQHDEKGRMTSIQYPDGRVVHQSRANNGLVRSISDDRNLFLSAFSYWPGTWRLCNAALGNGDFIRRDYDNAGRLHELSVKSGDTPLVDMIFRYTATGSLASAENRLDPSGNMTYSYDELKRIHAVEGPIMQEFRYDAFGNRALEDGGITQQKFDAHNRFDMSTGVTYDDGGEMTYDGTHRYAYDAEGLITSVDDGAVRYSYDAEGSRIQKTQADGIHDYVWLARQLLAERGPDGTWTDYIYADGRRLASVTRPIAAADGTVSPPITTYYVTDPFGILRVALSQFGTLVAKGIFTPYGREISATGSTAASSISYNDEEHDTETGLDDYRSRSYNPRLGRWMTPDPSSLHYSTLTNSQTFNLYTFMVDDPLKAVSANGLW